MDEPSNITRQPRTEELDPDLVRLPRSVGWAFDLPACFRRALDIQLTTLAENKITRQAWTQGKNYDFQVGDTLYDTAAARDAPWLEALHQIKTCLEVISARKAEPVNATAGEVVFRVLHPNSEHTALVAGAEVCRGTQNDFSALLRHGRWHGTHHSQL